MGSPCLQSGTDVAVVRSGRCCSCFHRQCPFLAERLVCIFWSPQSTPTIDIQIVMDLSRWANLTHLFEKVVSMSRWLACRCTAPVAVRRGHNRVAPALLQSATIGRKQVASAAKPWPINCGSAVRAELFQALATRSCPPPPPPPPSRGYLGVGTWDGPFFIRGPRTSTHR